MTVKPLLAAAVPLPAVLAGGAGAVVGAAAVLSGWAAQHPALRTQRWTRPLPRWLRRAVDATPTRVVLRVIGVLITAGGLGALARRDAPADALIALPALVGISLLAGPAWRLLNPARIGLPLHSVDDFVDTDVWPASGWLAALGLVALSATSAVALATTAALYVVVQAIVGSRRGLQWQHRHDAFAALADLAGHLSPVGRDPDGQLVWRNPLVAATHATLPRGALALCAVVIGLSAASALDAAEVAMRVRLPVPIAAALLLSTCAGVAGTLLRLALIRPFFHSAAVPVTAAYGLLAAGRWWPPADLLVFVGLHVVAVAILHRQALARHDLRTARAVQFPPRLLLVASVTCGLALWAGG
jgi:hypothetical protein